MIAVLQRVKKACVKVESNTVGECEKGLLILLGVKNGDTKIDAELLSQKILKCRIFNDENDKMNLSLKDIDGEALIVSNFTLLANYKKGNRPDYLNAAPPQIANELYEYFSTLIKSELKHTGNGVFGAEMEVSIINDGPITIVMDSEILKK